VSEETARPERVCFTLKIKEGMLEDYVQAHEDVWPEMLEALRESGWHNYSLFVRRRDGLVVGYLETADFNAALHAVSQREVNDRWQGSMAKYFEIPEGQNPDDAVLRLDEYFHLD